MSQTIPRTTKCGSCGHHYGSHAEPGQLQYICYYSGGGGCDCAGFVSSVDTATAASPSQNILHGLQEQIGVSTPQTWVTGYDGVPAYGGIPRETQASGESSTQQAYVGNAVDYGYPKGVKVSGVPCPNCQALGPHMCPAHDGLRWAQQDELNAATARVIAKMQLQINCLQDASNNFAQQPQPKPTDDADLREILNDLLRTDTNIMGSIDNLAKMISRQERAIADLRKMAEHPLHVGVIGSDVSAAAAPSSPNIDAGVGWVSCADRLPPSPEYVLVAYVLGVDIAGWEGRTRWGDTRGNHLYGVTHWMPLPPPPAATSAQPATPATPAYDDGRCLCGGRGCNRCEPQGRG